MAVRLLSGALRSPMRFASGRMGVTRGDAGAMRMEAPLLSLFGPSGAPSGYQASGLVWALSDGWIGAFGLAGIGAVAAGIGATAALESSISGAGAFDAGGNRGVQRTASIAGVAAVTASPSGRGNLGGVIRIGANPGAVDIAAEILDVQIVETGLTVRETLKVMLAAMAGKVSISGSTVTFRAGDDSRNVIVATVDGDGRRTSVTLTP